MSSIVTNNAAMTALQSLTQTMKNMETTQGRISTGLRVSSAADNAAYWSIATTMRSDHMALSTVKDALNLGSSTIDVAYTGLKSAIDVTSQIKQKLVAAAQPGVDREKIQSEVTQLQKQLKSISDSAVFSGQNWLSADSAHNPEKKIVSSYQHNADGSVTVGTIDLDISNVKLFDSTATATAQTVYDVSFTVAAGDDLEDDIAAKFGAGAADGDTAAVKLLVGGKEVDAIATVNGTDYDITFSSTEEYTDASTPGVKVKGGAAATDDAVALGVATRTNFVNAGGILDSVDAITNVSVFSLDISDLTDDAGDQSTLNLMTKQVDAAIASMTSASADLGSVKSRVSLQQSFVSSLMASIDKGIGALIDADMNEESTRLQALQVQQQLGVQALSLANQSAQSILSLFRG